MADLEAAREVTEIPARLPEVMAAQTGQQPEVMAQAAQVAVLEVQAVLPVATAAPVDLPAAMAAPEVATAALADVRMVPVAVRLDESLSASPVVSANLCKKVVVRLVRRSISTCLSIR